MKWMDKDPEAIAEEVTVKVKTDAIAGSMYSQVVGITVTEVDLTLDFVYIHPRGKADGTPSEGQVVARVTLPVAVSKGLAASIIEAIEQHEQKKKGMK